jgi:ABC-type multidrug transport system ATPase subunit
MKISLTNAGKRFNRDWIFRHLSYEFIQGNAYAITGPNGSGKSTLLQVISGAMVVSEGKVHYDVPEEEFFRHMSITAPYLELIEEMTAQEFLHFHTQFKPLIESSEKILEKAGLANAAHKQIRYFSSGMKQRLKLAQAIFSDVPCVLLDEPCTNLDADGIALYQQLISEYCRERLVIVSSNDVQEYGFCREVLKIGDYKQKTSGL